MTAYLGAVDDRVTAAVNLLRLQSAVGIRLLSYFSS